MTRGAEAARERRRIATLGVQCGLGTSGCTKSQLFMLNAIVELGYGYLLPTVSPAVHAAFLRS
jgi:hypothetical protein